MKDIMKDQIIIDFHAHLGDIFKDARNVIYKLDLKPADIPDPFTVREERGFKGPFITEDANEALREFIDVNHERCRTNTLENMQREMDECGTDYPFGSYKRQVEQVMIATEGDPELRNLVFFENANRLLHIV